MRNLFLSTIIIFNTITMFAQIDKLRIEIENLVNDFDGTVGVSIRGIETNDTLSMNGEKKFPMQSVYKFPLTLAVLNFIDRGIFSLTDSLFITNQELLPDTWSPLKKKYPERDITIPLTEIISATVAESDNNGCDILFRKVGGPKVVEDFIHRIGITEISIKNTEEEMHKDWSYQFDNWCTPKAMSELFTMFYKDEILLPETKNFLWTQLVNTYTGQNRLKGLLPAGTLVAHKTGSSGRSDKDVIAALNDAGIIVTPDGKHISVTVFISNTTSDEKTCELIIAKIARAVWDYYSIE